MLVLVKAPSNWQLQPRAVGGLQQAAGRSLEEAGGGWRATGSGCGTRGDFTPTARASWCGKESDDEPAHSSGKRGDGRTETAAQDPAETREEGPGNSEGQSQRKTINRTQK
eukprot:GHVT01064188.1.p4 GENE.GHVT01064188.1~~GHVT01064188.1.p4  ORF type:complete len:111 (-),score=22.47 GHVT01064188.1:311-643(-)